MPVVETPKGNVQFPDDMSRAEINRRVAEFMDSDRGSAIDDAVIKTMTPVNRAIAGVAGLPGDIEGLIAGGVNWLGSKAGADVGAKQMLPGSEDIKQFILDRGVPMRNADSAAGRIAQDSAQYGLEALGIGGAGAVLKGGANAARLAATNPLVPTAGDVALDALQGAGRGLGEFSANQAKTLAATGALSGAGAAGAGEVTNQNPLWRLAGGLGGGVLGGSLAARALASAPSREQALAYVKQNYPDMMEGAQESMAKLLMRNMTAQSSQAVSEAGNLPVPIKLTKGQANRFDPDLRFEQGAAQGRFGDAAARMFNPAEQQQALADNIPAIQGRVAQSQPLIQQGQGAQSVQDALVALEKKARGQYQSAYKAAQDLKADVPVDVAQGVLDKALSAINDFHPSTSTQARAILADLQDEIAKSPNGLIPLGTLNTRLSQLGKSAGGGAQLNPEQAAAAAARSAGQDALFDLPAEQIPVSAQGFVEAWNGAKDAYKQWAQLYKKSQGEIPTLTQRLTERGRMAGELDQRVEEPLKALFGGGNALNASPRQLEHLKGVLGDASPEWNQVRQEAWLKLMSPAMNQTGAAREISGVNINKILDNAFRTQGKTLDVLFSPEEQAMMKAYARTAYAATAGPSKYNTASDMGNAITRLAATAGAHPLLAPFTTSLYGMARGGLRNTQPLTRNPSALATQRQAQAAPSILDLLGGN
jgi:hypothetical protein